MSRRVITLLRYKDSILGLILINIFINPKKARRGGQPILAIFISTLILTTQDSVETILSFSILTNVETTLGYDQRIHSTCFWLWLIEKNGKHEKYSMEKDVRKYNAIYMKVIRKWQREFADSKINSCTDGTIRPYLCFLTLIRFHIIKKQNMCFYLFSFCFLSVFFL